MKKKYLIIVSYLLVIASIFLSSMSKADVKHNSQEAEAALIRIKDRTHKLALKIADFWIANGLDKAGGGIYGYHDIHGNPENSSDKGLIQQARHLWFFSTLRKENFNNPSSLQVIDEICHNTYSFIVSKFHDNEDHFFRFMVNFDGTQIKDKQKQFYANAFAIYAISQYGMTFPERSIKAKEYALNCFNAIVKKGFDEDFGGYDQSQDPWYFSTKERQENVTKDYNTHLHILEAFTTLYLFTKDQDVKKKLNDLTDVFLNKMIGSRNYIHLRYKKDWAPYGNPVVSYGHDLEAIWLLMKALHALGREGENDAIKKLITVGAHSAERGFDSSKGGYFEEGIPDGNVTKTKKVWWVQAEALGGLLQLYAWTHDAGYLDKINKTLDWIEKYQVIPNVGEWYSELNAEGIPEPSALKAIAHVWKTPYHAGRALVFYEKWIDEILKQEKNSSKFSD